MKDPSLDYPSHTRTGATENAEHNEGVIPKFLLILTFIKYFQGSVAVFDTPCGLSQRWKMPPARIKRIETFIVHSFGIKFRVVLVHDRQVLKFLDPAQICLDAA